MSDRLYWRIFKGLFTLGPNASVRAPIPGSWQGYSWMHRVIAETFGLHLGPRKSSQNLAHAGRERPANHDGALEVKEPSDNIVTQDPATTTGRDRPNDIFVVHGRDDQAHRAVLELLRYLGLRPVEWEEIVAASGGMTPMQRWPSVDSPARVLGAVVVLTPDDVVMLRPDLRSPREEAHELRPAMQPRPNVLLELGMFLALYPRSTLVLEFGNQRPIADLAALNTVRFNNDTSTLESVRKVIARLRHAGYAIDEAREDLDTRLFAGLTAYSARPL